MRIILLIILNVFILSCVWAGDDYAKHFTTKFSNNFVVDYPKTWKVSEIKDNVAGLSNVIFTQINHTGILQGYISISESKSGSSSLEAFAKDILARRVKLKDMKVISNKAVTCAGIKGKDIILSYIGRDRLEGPANVVTIIQRLIVLEKGDSFFTFKYESPKNSYDSKSGDFDHMLQSVVFN